MSKRREYTWSGSLLVSRITKYSTPICWPPNRLAILAKDSRVSNIATVHTNQHS
jgi:hypothetical protein